MNQEVEFSEIRIIECMAIIDIDPTLTHFKPACMFLLIADRIKMDIQHITLL